MVLKNGAVSVDFLGGRFGTFGTVAWLAGSDQILWVVGTPGCSWDLVVDGGGGCATVGAGVAISHEDGGS